MADMGQAQPNVGGMEAAQAQRAPQEEGGGGNGEVLMKMVGQVDQSLTQLSQVIGKSIPEAGQKLAELNEAYREIIQGVMEQAQTGQAPSQAPARGAAQAPVDVNAGAGNARQVM